MNEKKGSALGALIKFFVVMVTIFAAIAGISIAVYKTLKKQINKKPKEEDGDLEIAVMALDEDEEEKEENLD